MKHRTEIEYQRGERNETHVSVYPNGSYRVVNIQRFLDNTRLEIIEFFD